MSFVLYVPQAGRVRSPSSSLTPDRVLRERLPDDVPCPRIRIFSLEGELFFGATAGIGRAFRDIAHRPDTACVVLR